MQKNSDSHPFQGTYKYYLKYRPEIPKEVAEVIAQHFELKEGDRVLDIGCGTGQVAKAMEEKCGEMTCLDPDSQMIAEAKKTTQDLNMEFTWINSSAEELGRIKEKLGTFKVATSSRAFHRMEADQVLKALDGLIEEGGGVALFSDRVLWGSDTKWQQALKEIIDKYSKEKLRKGQNKSSNERWEDILTHSPFNSVTTREIPTIRTWDTDAIIGYTFSTAYAASYLFGEDLDEFKEELRDKLLSINPEGRFQENAVWRIVLGARKPLR